MGNLSWRKEGKIAILTMDKGENRHNPEFLETFLGLMDEIENDSSVSSLIIASASEKHWSLGIDLEFVLSSAGDLKRHDELRAFLHRLNDMFLRLLTYPMPVIAAINGHAFGDGAIMSCACDFRFMRSDRGFFCFPEVDINIPFLPGMQAIVKKAIPRYKLEELALSAKRTGAQELFEAHVITKACNGVDALMEESLKLASKFDKRREIFAEMKKRMNKEVIAAIKDDDPAIIQSLKLTI